MPEGFAHGLRQGWISALQNDPPFARRFAHTRGRRLILAAAQSRSRNPSYGAAAARAAERRKPEQIESSLLFPK